MRRKLPLERHNEQYRKKLALQRERLLALVTVSGVTSIPPSVVEHLSVAYKDCQTSLNNLNSALATVRSLSSSQASLESQHQESQLNQSAHQNSQVSNSPEYQEQASQQQTSQSLPTLSLTSLERRLRDLEHRQISNVKWYRKCFAYLGFRQSFVDQLEGVTSIYEDDYDPAIDPGKGIRNASTE